MCRQYKPYKTIVFRLKFLMLGLTMMYNLEGSDAWMRWVLTALPKGERDERKLEDGKSGFIQMPTFG